jgi:hypothetical protein
VRTRAMHGCWPSSTALAATIAITSGAYYSRPRVSVFQILDPVVLPGQQLLRQISYSDYMAKIKNRDIASLSEISSVSRLLVGRVYMYHDGENLSEVRRAHRMCYAPSQPDVRS